jgi:hypothetical protein
MPSDIVDLAEVKKQETLERHRAKQTRLEMLTRQIADLLQEDGYTSTEALALIWPVRFATKSEAGKLVEFIQKIRMPPEK